MKVEAFLVASLLLLGCHIGHAMECYSCDYGTCLFPMKTSCSPLQVCGTATAKTGNIGLKQKGCLNAIECLTESSVTYIGMTITTTRSCCITNLCNSAAAPKVSVITGIATMLALVLAKF
ncbi:lymphocyte antigen 6 complex locus protein G6d [Leptodactylus fuscus]|uniref:lymphocyte antigen 6 complex locus protein G6d n=1 Tax=Leptodactylus fuscus TaxID=238119 RepID=UPI003F4F158D